MTIKKAGDLLVPLEEYPIVDCSATVLDAVIRLDEARRKTGVGRQPYQAVLVADKEGKIVGKLGQLALLKALDPRSRIADDQDALARAGVSDNIMETAFGHARSFQVGLSEMCAGTSALPVQSVMDPFGERIDIGTPIHEVIHQMLERRNLSFLVTKDGRPVGLIRLSDLCDEVMRQMRQAGTNQIGED
ncbi:MAG: CBS domain-containing protein [bacterium]|nr:CBS domain-containing protein [bacterium]